MSQSSYSQLADQIIKGFIKAFVLIDDHWSESQVSIPSEVTDSGQIDVSVQSVPPAEIIESSEENSEIGAPSTPATTQAPTTDPAYLRDIGKKITEEGFLFTGFSYTEARKDTAFNLASKSDVLILDWLLGNGDPEPALDLLMKLKETGSPRFIFILTNQTDLGQVREKITERLGERAEGANLVFNCGHFSFSLKNKPETGGENTVNPEKVLEEAIIGIRQRFGGLLQLAALEILNQYRDRLHEVLSHFDKNTDLPFVLEWFENESPIGPNQTFSSLAVDEWTARVARRFPVSKSRIFTDDSVAARIREWGETTLPGNWTDKLREAINGEVEPFPTEEPKIEQLKKSLDEWLQSSRGRWPTELKGLPKGKIWCKTSKRLLSMSYMGIKAGVDLPMESLINLDVLFQCQANLPTKLDQGTVVKDNTGTYFICITPMCDCTRPGRVKNNYVFLSAQKIELKQLHSFQEGIVVAIRTNECEKLILAVDQKPTFTLKIADPLLDKDLEASFPFGSIENKLILKPIAQLRQARVMALVSLAASNAISVGLDRSELLRQLCDSKRELSESADTWQDQFPII